MTNPVSQEQVISLGYEPRNWQQQCHLAPQRFRVFALHRRAGKTVLGCMELIDRALKFDKELGLFIYCAPFLRQAKAIAWGILKLSVKHLIENGICTLNEGELTIKFTHNQATIRLLGGDNPDAMRGVRLDGCVIDEVAQIKPEVWTDILQPALSDRKGWAIFIGTPNGINLFSELFYKAQTLPDWDSKVYTVYETDSIDPVEVERLKRDMAPSSFAREYLCDFTAAGDDQLMSVGSIEEASRRIYKVGEFDYAPRIMGVDPARFGDDASVILKRQGLQIFDPIDFHGIDNMALADQVAYHIRTWEPDAVFIDMGNGVGVIDRLRQLGHSIIEVNFGGSSTEPMYANKRAQMWGKLKDWLNDGGAIPNHQRMKQDLGIPTYWFNNKNQIMLESKDDIKSRGLPSTDYGDAACLTFAAPVAKINKNPFPSQRMGHTINYNPLSREHVKADVQTRHQFDYNPLGRRR